MPKHREKSKYEEVCAVVPNQIMEKNEKAKRTKEMGLVFQLGIRKAVIENKLLELHIISFRLARIMSNEIK